MTDSQRFHAHRSDRAQHHSGTSGSRDLLDATLWDASVDRSRRRRNAPSRPAGILWSRAAALAVGVTVTASGLAPPASSVAHQTTGDRSVTTQVQQKLEISADGIFGPETRRAVIAFQASRGLEADGIVGPATRAALGISGQAPAAAAAPASPSESAGGSDGSAAAAAGAQVGKPYAYGGNGPGAFDCSGLTVHAFAAAGISLPRTSYAQFGSGRAVDREAIQSGDLVFFDSNGPGASHVGVATGPTTVVSATSRGVMETSLDSAYWSEHYVGARRVG